MVRGTKTNKFRRNARHIRVRRRVKGVSARPRLAIFRSLSHVYAQVIDDTEGKTLVAASSLESEVRTQVDGNPKVEVSKLVGALVARRAVEKGVSTVVFDRGGHKYHGRIKALADAARQGGLIF
jgi:large subunit ribosomal protein L18